MKTLLWYLRYYWLPLYAFAWEVKHNRTIKAAWRDMVASYQAEP